MSALKITCWRPQTDMAVGELEINCDRYKGLVTISYTTQKGVRFCETQTISKFLTGLGITVDDVKKARGEQ